MERLLKTETIYITKNRIENQMEKNAHKIRVKLKVRSSYLKINEKNLLLQETI